MSEVAEPLKKGDIVTFPVDGVPVPMIGQVYAVIQKAEIVVIQVGDHYYDAALSDVKPHVQD